MGYLFAKRVSPTKKAEAHASADYEYGSNFTYNRKQRSAVEIPGTPVR
jgi:hypothetical protein